MSEKRFVLCKKGDKEYIEDNGCVQLYGFDVLCEMLNEQQDTINKLREILAEAEDMIEVRLAEHYIKEYENIKHHIIGDNDEREAI